MTDFIPQNELENDLISFYQKKIDMGLFAQRLLNSKIIISLDREIDEKQPNANMNPLVIRSLVGEYDVIAIFSDLTRTKPLIEKLPQYKYALIVDCRWFLRGVTDNVGLALNPGLEYGIEMPPQGLQKFKKDFQL